MDTKALRQKILDLAIRGKLVPQNPEDEPASVLLERIREQKKQMVKDGKLKAKDIKNDTVIFKGEDSLHYEKFQDGTVKCIEDEIPFDLPDGWAWCKIGPLCEYITSGSRGWAQYYSDTGTLFLRMGNLSRNSFELRMENLQRVALPDNIEGVRTRVMENDLLFSITAEIGMLGLVPAGFEEAYINQHVGLIRFLQEAQTKYFPYILMSDFCRNQYYTTQSGMKNSFRLDNIQNILTPVPPLSEQIRIAEKLSSIWVQIQQIDSESTTANNIISMAKFKILDLAIRGQLVPQDPNDEPASVLLERIRAEKEKLIQQGEIKRDKKESVIFRGEDNSYYEKIGDDLRCIDEEIPFEIPDGWIWCRLNSIGAWQSGSTPNRKIGDYYGGDIPWIKTGDLNNGYITDIPEFITEKALNETAVRLIPAGTVLIAMYGATIGKVGITTCDATTNQACCACCYPCGIAPEYLFYYLQSQKSKFTDMAEGGAQPNISREKIIATLIPLPSYQEQLKILDKLKAFEAYISDIEKSLS